MCHKKHQTLKWVGLGLCLIAALVLGACSDATATPNAMLGAAGPTPSPQATTIPATPYSWQTFRSRQADFTVEYPISWTAAEHSEEGGIVITDFTPGPAIGMGIQVITTTRDGANDVQPQGDEEVPGSDLPNTHCQRITVGGLAATRCFDTISFSTSTTLNIKNNTYRISGEGKNLDLAIYQHFLDTIRFVPSLSVP